MGRLHCAQQISNSESSDVQSRLNEFKYSRGSVSNLLQAADIAVLLTKTLAGSICGMAGMLGPGSGEPIAWVAKECAGGQQMSFHHEITTYLAPSITGNIMTVKTTAMGT